MIEERLKQIFSDVFKIDSKRLENDISYKEIDDWDSLRHLVLLMAIEKEFNVKFETGVIPKLTSLKIILLELEKRNVK